MISWYFIEVPAQKKVYSWLQKYEGKKNQDDTVLMMENPKITASDKLPADILVISK